MSKLNCTMPMPSSYDSPIHAPNTGVEKCSSGLQSFCGNRNLIPVRLGKRQPCDSCISWGLMANCLADNVFTELQDNQNHQNIVQRCQSAVQITLHCLGRHIYNYVLLLSIYWIVKKFSLEKAHGILLMCMCTANRREAKGVT